MRPAFSNALYYPTIDIQDSDWLKTAALFWDSISTIVPASEREPYKSRDTQYLAAEDFLRPIIVDSNDEAVVGIERSVIEYINSLEFFNFCIFERDEFFSLRKNNPSWGFLHGDEGYINHLYESGIYSEKLSYKLMHDLEQIYPEKMSLGLRNRLDRLGNSLGRSHGRPDRYLFEPAFAKFYMTLLANKICENRSLALVADNISAENLSNSFRFDNFRHYDDYYRRDGEINFEQGILLDLAINNLRISPDTDLESILRFKKEHRDELGSFRTQLAKLVQGIPENLTPEATYQTISDIYTNEFLPDYNRLTKALKGSRIQWLSDSLVKLSAVSFSSISIPVFLGATAPQALLAGAGCSLLASAISYNVSKREQLQKNPYSYLLKVERGCV